MYGKLNDIVQKKQKQAHKLTKAEKNCTDVNCI